MKLTEKQELLIKRLLAKRRWNFQQIQNKIAESNFYKAMDILTDFDNETIKELEKILEVEE